MRSNSLLATCGSDRKCRVWEVEKPHRFQTCAAHSFDLNSVGSALSFSREDETISTGLQSGSIKLWSMETGQNARTLPGHRAEVSALQHYEFHDANLLMSGSNACDMKLWDIRKRGTIISYTGHEGPVRVIRFRIQSLTFTNGTLFIIPATGLEIKNVFGKFVPVRMANL